MSGHGGESRVSRGVTVVNARGLHARAAAKFVDLAKRFDAEIEVSRDGVAVSGLSIMGLMMFAAGPGSRLEIRASGREAVAVVGALARLVESSFHES